MSNFNNHLINETSPYLLQHAHNPVDWYPWGPEALEKATSEDKPILVSIGYSACHWCHVMERESFEDESTANLMNELFVNIKIDREERPDLDHIYMDAVQAIAGNGGWPLNVFLTPSAKPFYGGTYFPPVRAYNRSSWKEVLTGVSKLFTEKRQEVEAQAEELIRHIEQSNGYVQTNHIIPRFEGEQLFTKMQAETIFQGIMKQADKQWGGFGNPPKFPQTFVINYLLRYHHYTGNQDALTQACLSLDKMIQGGIYDQLGGGFARYSTDGEWLAPHFEKMLYDNALLISSIADAYRITQKESYRISIIQSIEFIQRELMDEDGGFYAALDADSEGEEGKFYVWSYEEVHQILQENAEIFCRYYDITPGGNWEHKNILRVCIPLASFASQIDMSVEDLNQTLDNSRERLLEQRAKRTRPSLDDKILVGWNALMIIALCKASAALSDKKYSELAIGCFNFLWSNCRNHDSFSMYHTIKNGIAKYPAFLDDYASLAEACIHLQEITSDMKYLEFARGLTEYILENFFSESGYFFYSSKQQLDIVVRKTENYDGATPSGNGVIAWTLHYLGIVFDNEWKQQAVELVQGISQLVEKYPGSFGNWGCLLVDLAYGVNEVAIIGTDFENFRDALLTRFIPNKVLQCAEAVEGKNYPLLKDKPGSAKPLLYLCRNYACEAPISDLNRAIESVVKNFIIR